MTDETDLDATAPKRRRATKKDTLPSRCETGRQEPAKPRSQFEGYVPVILKLFLDRWRPGAATVVFSLDDVRTAVEAVRAVSDNPDAISCRNPADVIYRMRSRYEVDLTRST